VSGAPATTDGGEAAPAFLAVTPLRVYAYMALTYRRTWRGSLSATVLNPVLFLLAMGLGLGSLVNGGHSSSSLGGITYLQFLAPGLLAASAMQTAAFESTYPILAAIKWMRTYLGMLASPIGVRGVVFGHLLWAATRITMTCAVFCAVMAAFGAARGPAVIWTVPVGVLTGLAFAAPISAFAATRETDQAFSALFRVGIVPMFLFSGVFFPVSDLPGALQPVAWATPLWHGVVLCRDLAVGHTSVWAALGHASYLLAWAVIGTVLALHSHRKRLVV
jgi:lipooligosaccharide transport system permease protein